jgi:hypothetical protein
MVPLWVLPLCGLSSLLAMMHPGGGGEEPPQDVAARAAARAAELRVKLLEAQLAQAEIEAELAQKKAGSSAASSPGATGARVTTPPPPPYTSEYGWRGEPPMVLRLKGDSTEREKAKVTLLPRQPAPVGRIAPAGKGAPSSSASSGLCELVAVGRVAMNKGAMEADSTATATTTTLAKIGNCAIWPNVRCNTRGCTSIERWSRMLSKKEFFNNGTEDSDGEENETYQWVYMCHICVARRMEFEGTPEEIEAKSRSFIGERAGNIERKRARVAAFSKAKSDVKEYFAAMGVTVEGRKLWQVSRSFFVDIFEGLSDMIALKARHMKALESSVEEHSKMVLQLKSEKEPANIRILVDRIEELSVARDLAAYKDRSEADQWAMITASSYADELCSMGNGGYFRYLLFASPEAPSTGACAWSRASCGASCTRRRPGFQASAGTAAAPASTGRSTGWCAKHTTPR